MKILLLLIGFLVATSAFSQEKYLSISDSIAEKESVFKEHNRIRVKTIQGGKVSGKLIIVDENQIMVGKIIIPIESIAKIKQNPLLLTFIVSGFLFVAGGYAILGGIVLTVWGGTGFGIAAGVIGGALIFTGIKSPNILPSVKTNANSNIKITNVLE